MNTTAIELNSRVEQFRDKGYTIFESVYSAEQIAGFRALFYRLREDLEREPADKFLVKNVVERAPKLTLPVFNNPIILDFAEMVMGPFVQISDSVMFGFNSQVKSENEVNGWHRDRYAQVPRGGYQNPLGLTMLCYLQDMTETAGPLRILPLSHRNMDLIPDDKKKRPHPQEQLISLRAGDVILFHSALLHSGTPNTSGTERIFLGGQYNSTWMRHIDNHTGPTVLELIEEARARNDHRTMRLFGVDEQLEKKVNSEFTTADDIRWAEWAAADKAAIRK